VSFVVALVLLGAFHARAQQPELRWGGDAEGGAPYVEADPNDPSRVVGFEVDVAQMLAEGLGRVPRFIQAGFTTLDGSVARGDFDIALSGIEDSPARRSRLAVTIPYHQFREVLTVREADAARFRTLSDLNGRRVATLGATLAFELLAQAQRQYNVIPITYEDDVHPYSDLALGRVDAVLLDDVIAERRIRQNPGLISQTTDIGVGYYVGILAPGNAALRDRMNDILKQAMRDGRLESIFRRWHMWNDDQQRLYARLGGGQPIEAATERSEPPPASAWAEARGYLPSLFKAAAITLALSCASMALAILVGVLIASGRVYGPAPVRVVLTAWVEVIRGTTAAVAALRPVLRACDSGAVAGPARGVPWSRAQLRGVRERDLSRRARGSARGAARCGAYAWVQRTSDADVDPRPTSVSPCAAADDQ
jgi:polar amino acid transport system substrate-binding protein